jgi:hypothetical protein
MKYKEKMPLNISELYFSNNVFGNDRFPILENLHHSLPNVVFNPNDPRLLERINFLMSGYVKIDSLLRWGDKKLTHIDSFEKIKAEASYFYEAPICIYLEMTRWNDFVDNCLWYQALKEIPEDEE